MSEQEKIHRYVIKSTPFGELQEVLKDLDKVSPIDLSSPALQSTIQEYNQEHLTIVNHQHVQQHAHSGEISHHGQQQTIR